MTRYQQTSGSTREFHSHSHNKLQTRIQPHTCHSIQHTNPLHQQGENPRSHIRHRFDIQRTHRHQTKMHTETQSSESYYRPRIWTKQGDNIHHTQTVYQIHSRILQNQLHSKLLRYTLQHATNTTKQCTENRHWLYQNNSHRPHTSFKKPKH